MSTYGGYRNQERIHDTPDYSLTDKQMQQRQQMANVKVVTTQPGHNVWAFEHRWAYSLWSCCTNMKECCFAFFCCCCYECKMHKRSGENLCTFMCPGSTYALRSKIRTAFRIEGTLCSDCCTSTFCPCCTAIQITRELNHQGL